MYHCRIRFYLTGRQKKAFEIIKGMETLEYFTHEFTESDMPEAALAAKADVIIADLQDVDVANTLQVLMDGRKETSEIILLANKGHMALLSDYLEEIKDIWILPMEDEQIRFRFLRW